MSKRNIIVGVVVICAVVGVLVGIACAYGMFDNIGTLLVRSGTTTNKTVSNQPTTTTAQNKAVAILSAAEQKKLAEQSPAVSGTKITTPQMTAAQRQTLAKYTQALSQRPFQGQPLDSAMSPYVGVWRTLGGYVILSGDGKYEVYFGIGGTVQEAGTWRITGGQLAFTNMGGEYKTPFEFSTTTKVSTPYDHWFGFNYRANNGTLVGVGTCGKYANTGDAANFDFFAQTSQCWAAIPHTDWPPDWSQMAADPVCRHTIAPGYGYNYPACDVYIGGPFSWQ